MATVWLLLATVLFLYWNDIDAVPDDWSYILGSSAKSPTTFEGSILPSLDSKITPEEKKQYAQNLIKLNETLRERFPAQ